MKNINKISSYNKISFFWLIGFILVYSNNVYSQDCVLQNGKYRVEFDKQFENHPKFELKIINDSIIYYDNDSIISRKIEKNSDCYLVIEKEKIDETNMTDFQKILNKQHPFYTFKKINQTTYEFIFRVDLHVMINSGKFILIEHQ